MLEPDWDTVLRNLEVDVNCSTTHNVSAFALGLFICLGMFVSYLPQHYKIIKSGTSEGFNPWFLLLGCLGAWSNVVNIVLLQWDVIGCCSTVTLGTCIEHILGIIQIAIQWMMFIIVFILFLIYFPVRKRYIHRIRLPLDDDEHTHEAETVTLTANATTTTSSTGGYTVGPLELSSEWRTSLYIAAAVAIHFSITFITSIVLLSSNGARHPETRQWAGVLGVFSMLVATIQYLPQIWTTWRAKAVGALSIPMMLIQTPGSFIFVYTLASREGTNWTTWITYLVSGCLQGVLLTLCVLWHRREQQRVKTTTTEDTSSDSSNNLDVSVEPINQTHVEDEEAATLDENRPTINSEAQPLLS